MDREKLLRELRITFATELEELVERLDQELLALELEPGAAELYRPLLSTAHSLKGGARAVSAKPLEALCHDFEEVLGHLRDGRLEAEPSVFKLLFKGVDAMAEAGKAFAAGAEPQGGLLADVQPRIAALAAGTEEPTSEGLPSAEPPSEELPSAEPPSEELPSAEPPSRESPSREPAAVTAAADEPSPSPASVPHDAGATVRVSAEKLDALLAQSGELLVAQRRLGEWAGRLDAVRETVRDWQADWRHVEIALKKRSDAQLGGPRAAEALRQAGERLRALDTGLNQLVETVISDERVLSQVTERLDDEVCYVRMVPFGDACRGLERTIRDLARASGKEVRLVVEGGDTEIDRSLLEKLRDPLRHLVRNAVDHGIETPEQRRASGKEAAARITVAAALAGSQVEISVTDDGRGLDAAALRRIARERGLPEPADERELAHLIFLPGLSTAAAVTEVSGRGVGLDIVQEQIESLHGRVDVCSDPGQGLRFELVVPLTLTTVRALLVASAGQLFAFASTNVRQLLRAGPGELYSVEGRDTLIYGGGHPIPLVPLRQVLGLGAASRNGQSRLPVVVVAAGGQEMAFAVEELVTEQEIVVKGLGARLQRLRNIAGATLLPDGRVALILNAADVIRAALDVAGGGASLVNRPAAEQRRRLLVVDDSVTTRTLHKNALLEAGYDVVTAVDGSDAWRILQDTDVDLVVSDVEMPRMDGLSLTAAIRESPRLVKLPVVLVTGLENERDKARGLETGADAYIEKSGFETSLLVETIARFL